MLLADMTQLVEALNLAVILPYAKRYPFGQTRKTKAKPRSTLKKLVVWIKQKYQIDCCRETVRKTLEQMGLFWD